MRIDREYHIWKIRRRHWEGLAVRCELDPGPLLDRVIELVASIPAATQRAAATLRDEGLTHPIVGRAEAEIGEHAERCLRVLEATGRSASD
jgi:hypothetical protein